MKKKLTNILLILVFLIGLSLLLYPSFSEYWNYTFYQSRVITEYSEVVAKIDDDKYAEHWQAAEAYNADYYASGANWELTDEQRERYLSLLDVTGTGIMGYIEIPKIGSMLAVYHGTDENVLQIAVGHVEGSSLPVGGESTHCVLSGHRGLPSAKLFTDLDQLEVGDQFMLHILDETLTYEVDQILIVLPHELEALRIQEGEDLCTLVTCTPYSVNTHRLLVRGHRVETVEAAKEVRVTADAAQVEPLLIAPFVAVPLLLLLLIRLMRPRRAKRKDENDGFEE